MLGVRQGDVIESPASRNAGAGNGEVVQHLIETTKP